MPRKSAPPQVAQDGLPGRIRAARAYADLSRDQLVERVTDPEITARKLARFELGSARPTDTQIDKLAEACHLPRAFFTVDFKALDDPLAALSARVDEVTAQLASLKALVVESSRGALSPVDAGKVSNKTGAATR